MAILDQNGKPITDEIASIRREVNRVFYGGVLQTNLDDTLQSRGGAKGLKIYQELKRDAHAGAVLAKRKLAVTSRPWDVLPASEAGADKKVADVVKAALEHLKFNATCKRLLEANLTGFAVSEVMWEVRDGLVLPAALKARDPRRFVFGVDDELRLLTREAMLIGEEMPERKFVVHRRGADDDNPYGTGLGAMLFWPVFFKRNGITFWLTFADKFGSPTALGRYPNGSGAPEQKKLLEALGAISQDAGVIVPEGMVIELLEAKRSGGIDTYETLVRYMDEQISKAVLGETMSTTASAAGMGSSQANVQNDVRIEVARDDSDELCETLNDTLVRWIVDFNFAGVGCPRVVRDFTNDDSEQINTFTIGIQRLVSLGMRIPSEWVHERFDIPQAAAGEETLTPAVGMADDGFGAVMPQPVGRQRPQESEAEDEPADEDEAVDLAEGAPLRKATAQRAFNKARQAELAAGAEALASEWETLVRKPVEDVLALAESSGGDLVAFRERLTTLLDARPDPEAVQRLAQAAFAANVMGRGLAPKKTWGQKLAGLVQRRKG